METRGSNNPVHVNNESMHSFLKASPGTKNYGELMHHSQMNRFIVTLIPTLYCLDPFHLFLHYFFYKQILVVRIYY
jgi:hypothetical protein